MIDGRECVGEENCQLRFYVKGVPETDDCYIERWQGLYCPRYQRFYCAGRGNCDTMESYMTHLVEFKRSRGV